MRSLEELNAIQASVGRQLLTHTQYDALVEFAVSRFKETVIDRVRALRRVKPEFWEVN
jgi:hypothetical protein